MPTLITCLSSGKGTWSEVIKVIKSQNWDKVFLIANDFSKENFNQKNENYHFVLINPFEEVNSMKNKIVNELKDKIKDFEVALNFVSGSGKEHMALMEAVLELGLNFRLISLNHGEVETLGISPNF
ncbi:MAG: hypothetical protein ABIH82_05840 [Candidatus Woesearchaeota archaeon]